MHIKEIIVDGFKSYAHRTVISGFDTHFNAITGLNGSGKSNILDAICFVLGITNLSQVRAGNLSELVYKQGQAGIHKAVVTVVFNNEDESGSPVGYEQCSEVTVTRQVLIGGKNKYLINGRVSPAGQVGNLFHSVQLNVNNPHFLIMQGRITKVLNMKSHEILGMVEEAAGTRMYENKRIAAVKTIEKKQKKMDELNSILSEEITPTLEKLRNEKQHYLKWSKNNADIERIERLVVASDYTKAQQTLKSNDENISLIQSDIHKYEEENKTYQDQIINMDEQKETLSSQLSGELGDAHREAKSNEENLSKDFVKATSAWQNSKNATISATNDLTAAQSLVHETEDSLKEKDKEIANDSQKIIAAKQEAKDAETELARLTNEYQNMCAGISSTESDEGRTLPDQISKAHSDTNNADAKSKQAMMKFKHLNKTIKSVRIDMKKEEKSSEKLAAKKAKFSEKVEIIKENLSNINFSIEDFNKLESEKIELENLVGNFSETVENLTAQLQGRLMFNFSDPVRGFDRSKVKGVVAKLIVVNNKLNSTALEVVAGGKLFQVIVDEAVTGKALLSRGKLQRRVTIIPLDKITSRCIPNSTVSHAKSIAQKMNTTAFPAMELVGFDEEIRTAIEYVFGSSMVVDGMDAGNKICDLTKTRTVTLEGDVYDPSGTISGGSRNNLGSTLSKLSELTTVSSEMKEAEIKLGRVNGKIESMGVVSKRFETFSDELELAIAELSTVDKHLSQTTFGMLSDKFSKMQTEIEESETESKIMEQEKNLKWALYNKLKEKEIELTRNREARLKDIEQQVEMAKKKHTIQGQKSRDIESQSQTLVLELDSLKSEIMAAEEAVIAARSALDETKIRESRFETKVADTKTIYDTAKLDLVEIEKKLSSCSNELKNLSLEKRKLSKKSENVQLNVKKLSLKVGKFQKDGANAERVLASMLKKHFWIEKEKEAFGLSGGPYDFEEIDCNKMSLHLQSLENEQNLLSKKINKKVMGMIEKAEGEYTELLRKRKVVENDKKKIEAVIEELDVKKKAELERTWIKVNRDFGSIFATLLPGTSAKLEPPEGMEVWEGLEVKVAFGNVWKQSLSELSGGQRSLLALSLILSLLLFKPAPMYILDEVDAALDLSHTQNIGNMLKTHFSQSQFIVVSLKEGMFNNANVIYRTKFVDGVSTVTRTIGVGLSSKSRALNRANENIDNNDDKTPGKRIARGRVSLFSGKEN